GARGAGGGKGAAKIIADALTFGRRVEKDYGEFGGIRARGFTEYVIDWEGGQWYLRTGFEEVFPGFLWLEGRTERWTTYWGDGLTQFGVVKSVIEDGI